MSVVNKKPYIVEKLEKLSSAELISLKSALNSKETQFSLVLNDISQSNKSIKVGELKLNYGFIRGVLVYTNSVCFFLSYEQSKKLLIYDINPNSRKFNLVKECLSISELRSVIDDVYEESSGGEDTWVNKMKTKVVQNGSTNTTEIGNNAEIDGNLTVNSQLEIGTSATIGTTLKAKFSSKRYIHRVQYSYSSVGVYISFISKEKEEIESMADLSSIIEEEGLLLKENLYGVNCIALNNSDYYQVLTMETGGAMIQLQLVSMQMGVAPILLNAGGTFSDYIVEL